MHASKCSEFLEAWVKGRHLKKAGQIYAGGPEHRNWQHRSTHRSQADVTFPIELIKEPVR